MYALNESLAIDGKAMYFGEKFGLRTSDFGPRTSDCGLRPRISGSVFSFPEKVFEFGTGDSTVQRLPLRFVDLDVGSAVEERRISAALPIEEVGLQPQWRHGAGGFANAALKGPLFHGAISVRRSKPQPQISRIHPDKAKQDKSDP
jgi:hypothetical protein